MARPIETDLLCVECGYNLRGAQRATRCPECGTPTAWSISGAALHFQDVRRLSECRAGLFGIGLSLLWIWSPPGWLLLLWSARRVARAGAESASVSGRRIANAVLLLGLLLTPLSVSGVLKPDALPIVLVLSWLYATLTVGLILRPVLRLCHAPRLRWVSIGCGLLGGTGLVGAVASAASVSFGYVTVPTPGWLGQSAPWLVFDLGRLHHPVLEGWAIFAAFPGAILLVILMLGTTWRLRKALVHAHVARARRDDPVS